MAFSGSHDDVFCAVNNVYNTDLCAIHIFHLKQALSTTVLLTECCFWYTVRMCCMAQCLLAFCSLMLHVRCESCTCCCYSITGQHH